MLEKQTTRSVRRPCMCNHFFKVHFEQLNTSVYLFKRILASILEVRVWEFS